MSVARGQAPWDFCFVRNENLIFIVAYNHERFIKDVVRRIPEPVLLDPANELLIIDDASRDETFKVSEAVSRVAAPRMRVTVLKSPTNQGYGGNQKLGYRYAIDQGFQRVFLIHGDGQYAPELLPDLIAEYARDERPDAVFGTRMADWSSPLRGGMPVYKFIGNKVLTTIQNAVLGTRMSEFHSGYRSYSTALLRRIPFERNANDFHFDTEIIIQAQAVGAKIKEVPISTHYGDEVCHVDGMKYARNVIRASMHYQLQRFGFLYDRRFDFGTQEYPLKPSPHSSHGRIIGRVTPGSRVLDVGCGRGFLARKMIDKGCVVDGIDVLDRDRVTPGLNRYLQTDLSHERTHELAAWMAEETYDFVILGDVLEHLVDPEGFLDLLRANLRRDRDVTVVVSTGNVAFMVVRAMLALGQFNYGPRGILDRTHTRLFTRKSLRAIFEQAGFQVLRQDGIPLPATAALGDDSRIGKTFEAANATLASRRPGLFAYQLWLEARPHPTVEQMLAITTEHSRTLRSGLDAEGPNGPPITPLHAKGTSVRKRA
jgi:2-polyprenyl-3-methyl-5-hydroxy-6-metoxy-1,4-benzoquinol methylase